MNPAGHRVLIAGGVVLAVSGLLSAASCVVNALSDPADGANIGAGLLLLASIPVAATGSVLVLVGVVLRRWPRGGRKSEDRHQGVGTPLDR